MKALVKTAPVEKVAEETRAPRCARGSASRKLDRMKIVRPDNKKVSFDIPYKLLNFCGSSPRALGYLLRRDVHPGRASSIRKLQRAHRIAEQ